MNFNKLSSHEVLNKKDSDKSTLFLYKQHLDYKNIDPPDISMIKLIFVNQTFLNSTEVSLIGFKIFLIDAIQFF